MINLLPTAQKTEITYARKNTLLLKWSAWLIFAIAIAAGLILAGNIYVNQSTESYKKRVEESKQTLETEKLGDAQKRIVELSNNVTLIQKVLEKNILFSKLLRQAGAAMPSGTILQNVEISKVEGGIDLTAGAKDYKTATQVQVNLADPKNEIFEKADIVSINCNSGDDSGYPCTINLRALFGDESPYLFINQKDSEALR